MENRDDRYFIEKVLNGEPAAFAPLVEKYKTMAYNISLKLVKRPEDAEEITQDAFVKAYRALRKFKGEAKFSTWLYRIIYNASVSLIRKKRREVILHNDDKDKIQYPDKAWDAETRNDEFMTAALKKAMDDLPGVEQTMLSLYYYQDSSIEDIAGIMSLSESNVKVRLFRTRKKLHDQIMHMMKADAR